MSEAFIKGGRASRFSLLHLLTLCGFRAQEQEHEGRPTPYLHLHSTHYVLEAPPTPPPPSFSMYSPPCVKHIRGVLHNHF